MKTLGKLEQIEDLRSIWKHEAKDFTPWLAEQENLTLLSDAVGIDLVLEETESNVGEFNVDILASEDGSNRRIVIENQLEETNHDHLGKIITYASGKDAEVVIWIVKHARDEHKRAVEWLNQHTDDKCSFFLVEIELWKISDSAPAVRFNVVERPNGWARAIKRSEGLSSTQQQKLSFWQSYIEYNQNVGGAYAKSQATADSWIGKSIKGIPGTSVNLVITKDHSRAEVYINRGSQDSNKEIFDKLYAHKDDIEAIYGKPLNWQRMDDKVTCRICTEISKTYSEEKYHKEIFKFFLEETNKILTVFGKYSVLFKK